MLNWAGTLVATKPNSKRVKRRRKTSDTLYCEKKSVNCNGGLGQLWLKPSKGRKTKGEQNWEGAKKGVIRTGNALNCDKFRGVHGNKKHR